MTKTKLNAKLILLAIIIIAAYFRFFQINWDQGHHLHPDERAIVMAVGKLKIPSSISEFLTPESPWNPHFFAYGSFPMYLLFFAGNVAGIFNPLFAQYDLINLIGRVLSGFADILTLILLFKIARKLFNSNIGLLAAFFYAVSVLPIQLSHFYAVDTFLTCFIMATIYNLLLFYEKSTFEKSALIGFLFGLSLATKISAFVLLSSIGITLAFDFVLIFIKKPHRPRIWLPHLPAFFKHLLVYVFTTGITTIYSFIFFEPYAGIDFKSFWEQTLQQSTLTNNPFYFPYTLQYVGKIPYIYELKNIFLWGLGPILASLSFLGFIYFIYLTFKKRGTGFAKEAIILVFFITYFFVVGKFAVGFMRYMLPLYPLFCLFAGALVYRIDKSFKYKNLRLIAYCLLLIASLVWPLSFMHIYTRNNTRVDASNWINQFVPLGKTLAIEHWDDGLPLNGGEKYHILTLALYDADTDVKWDVLNQELKQTDFIIIASNRLYAPLQKLTDCGHLPIGRCYPRASLYYKDLFSGRLGFKKVAEFSSYPTIPLLNIPIDDQGADESFTVNERPKVMIFQKSSLNSTM